MPITTIDSSGLSSPITLNLVGGTVNGTVSGNQTYSGNQTFSGNAGFGTGPSGYRVEISGSAHASTGFYADQQLNCPRWRTGSGDTVFFSGGRTANTAAFDMFDITGLGGSNGFIHIEIYFAHNGGGEHGSFCRFIRTMNAYDGSQDGGGVTIERVNTNWGGGNNFIFNRPSNDIIRVRWAGASSFADAYSLYGSVRANRFLSLSNIGMTSFAVN